MAERWWHQSDRPLMKRLSKRPMAKIGNRYFLEEDFNFSSSVCNGLARPYLRKLETG
jgi:hypothetical protein